MPQLIGLALIGAGLYAGLKAVVRIGQRVAEDLQRAKEEAEREEPGAEKDLGALELDPATGVYRPANRRVPMA